MLSKRQIPINFGSNFENIKRNNSTTYCIPTICTLTLLLLGLAIINPTVYSIADDTAYATENPTKNSAKSLTENISEDQSQTTQTKTNNNMKDNLSNADPTPTDTTPSSDQATSSANNFNSLSNDNSNISTLSNNGIATLSDEDNDSSAALIVDDGIIYDTILADAGSPVYKSHTITIKAANLESYVLQVSATNVGTSELVNKDNTTYKVAGVGTSGVLGKNIPSGTWGIGWGDTSTLDENLTYYTLPAYGTTASNIQTGQLESVSNLDGADVNTTKKLTLAANFAPTTPDGHYTTSLLLSLAVEPKKLVAWNDLVYMQDMNSMACNEAPFNTQKTLIDKRDNASYTIARIKNKTDDTALCWMTQNLRIVNKTLTSTDSDVINSFTIPTSSLFGSDIVHTYQPHAYYGGNTDYGSYYNWYTATAGTGNASITADGKNATGSICPKGWRLPVHGSYGDFYNLTNGMLNTQAIAAPYNFKYGGYVNGNKLVGSDGSGSYWSSAAAADDEAYRLSISTSTYSKYATISTSSRIMGYSVRCVAR